MASRKRSARVRGERHPVYQPGCKQCYISMASECCPSTARLHELAGALADLARSRGHSPGFADIAIAATARRHDLTILSRNERHFASIGAVVVDPFQKLPLSK